MPHRKPAHRRARSRAPVSPTAEDLQSFEGSHGVDLLPLATQPALECADEEGVALDASHEVIEDIDSDAGIEAAEQGGVVLAKVDEPEADT